MKRDWRHAETAWAVCVMPPDEMHFAFDTGGAPRLFPTEDAACKWGEKHIKRSYVVVRVYIVEGER